MSNRVLLILTIVAMMTGSLLARPTPGRAMTPDPGRTAEAWARIREALEASPADKTATRNFNALWHHLDAHGWIDVGRTRAQVREKLGEPDTAVYVGNDRERWYYRWWCLDFVDDRLFEWVGGAAIKSASPSFWPRMSGLSIGDRRFVAVHRARAVDHGIVEYVPQGQGTRRNDTMIVVQRFVDAAARKTPGQHAQGAIEGIVRIDPDAGHRIVRSESDDVVLEWWIDGERAVEAQHEISRYVVDRGDVLRIAITRKLPRMPDAERRAWLSLIQGDLVHKLADADR